MISNILRSIFPSIAACSITVCTFSNGSYFFMGNASFLTAEKSAGQTGHGRLPGIVIYKILNT